MTHPVCAEPVQAGFFFQQPENFPLFLILCGNLPANAIKSAYFYAFWFVTLL